MRSINEFQDYFLDLVAAVQLVGQRSWQRSLNSWLYVPFGIVLILLSCFAVDSLIKLSSVSFPASVACMILLFLGLIIYDLLFGNMKSKAVVSIIDIPAAFALKYINILFTPSFVLLPLSPPIGGIEVGKIAVVFVLGYVVMFGVTAYMVRALQLVFGSSKRAVTERAEEMGAENDAIPLTDSISTRQNSQLELSSNASFGISARVSLVDMTTDMLVPPRAQDPSQIRGTGGPPVENPSTVNGPQAPSFHQTPLPLSRPQIWAAFIISHINQFTYAVLFLIVGIPVYYGLGYAMPAQLTFSILAYFLALSIPARWRQFLHPVLVSSAITILGIWVLGLVKGNSLQQVLNEYRTGTKYLQLWEGNKGLRAPGAGDVFSSVLDASIVALALPMFQYRKELKQHFFAIVIPNFTISISSLFGYPALCYAIGITSQRSLSFTARSLTLALATPSVDNLGGDANTVAALCIMSGVLGVLIGPKLLHWLHIPEEDYVTRGVTLGGNSSAIATALLLMTDPRAAALSCLSMSLFGTITVVLTSIPPVVNAIRALVDL